jgi:hypothetical protein
MRMKHRLLPMALLVAGCVAEQPKPAPRPVPTPIPVRPAPPAPRPVPVQPRVEWQDLPVTPGSWTYDGGAQQVQASFGASPPSFIIRCDLQSRQVQLLRPGTTTGNAMTVQTSDSRRTLPLSVTPDTSATPYVTLNAQDPLFDSLAFSRGHFSVEVPGLPMLVIPSWPEPARVVEECRG